MMVFVGFTECFYLLTSAQDSVFHQLNKLKEINSLTKESNLLIFFCPPEKRWSISHRERTANFSVSLLTMVWLLQQICADVCVFALLSFFSCVRCVLNVDVGQLSGGVGGDVALGVVAMLAHAS